MKFKEKEKVAIIALYDSEELDISYSKEEFLKNYCNDNKYEIVKVFREPQLWNQSYSLRIIIDILKSKKFNEDFNNINDFSKVIIYNIGEICENDEAIITVNTLFDSNKVELESIMQGVIGKDLTYKASIKKIDSNRIIDKYLIKEDEPF